ncbi:TPA: hypothetical protein ACF8UL_002641 [Staphylococcus aureus]|nr:hypothetical protein [Staphylococcus aureus]HDT6187850.1 hypothetical protein [Staphylococcus aureus]HDT6193109.1 hypothetical protein [Staphylococcus aureus]HDT6194974.1 hypothetical protein [Staphylococcus aureus]HDT6233742.1 hypothetical protein [Staphylococcus aureus]
MQSPQLQLYNKAFDLSTGYGVPVVSKKEMTDEPSYPFIVLGKMDEHMNIRTFDSFDGLTSVTVDVWSKYDDLGSHDAIVYGLQKDLTQLEVLPNYQIRINDLTINQLPDNTTNQLLVHSQIVAEYDTY